MGSTGFQVCVLAWFFIWISGVFVTVETSPVVDEDNKGFRYEEYLIEHEISSAQAKKALMAINFTTGRFIECNLKKQSKTYLKSTYKNVKIKKVGIDNFLRCFLHEIPINLAN